MTRSLFGVLVVSSLLGYGTSAVASEPDQLTASSLSGVRAIYVHMPPSGGIRLPDGGHGGSGSGGPLQGFDSIVNFTGQFSAQGVDSLGNPQTVWPYAMAGNPPGRGGRTTINAPIIPVSLDLRNYDGTPRYVNGQRLYYDATQYVQPVLNSPIFQKTWYSSSESRTQYTDAIQRAEFWNHMEDDWHTMLAPVVKTPRVMTLIRGTYLFALNADGSCCRFVLVDANVFVGALFPPSTPDNSTVIGAAEVNGDITTHDISTFLFPNAFLYIGTTANCCILGFHSFDQELGDATNGNLPRFYVMNYSSWISPGLFGGGFADVTALSHELSETFNDPFVSFDGIHNQTPWWLSPNGNCQDNLEVGDVIEGLPSGTYAVTMNGFTYHPQNEALLQWFAFRSPSNALNGAYSYPDPSVLASGLSAPQKVNCAP
jgi:hypothetical protein